MYINNKSIKKYHARLLERVILPSSFSVDSFWSKSALSPKIDKNIRRQYKGLYIKLELEGTYAEVERTKSRLIKDISISEIQFESLSGIYNGYIVSLNIDETFTGFETISINMNVVEEDPQKQVEFKNNIKLILNNTEVTPCILELTPTMNLIDVTITGLGEDIYIKNLTKDKKIIIDGDKGLVLEEGLNKWADYDSWSFPKLSPGENNISINKSSINAVLKYKARWI